MFDRKRKRFNREMKQTEKMVNAIFVFTMILIALILSGGAFVVYRILLFFGIL